MEQINLNIIPDGVMPVCHASQFDKNRTIRFNLKDNGSVYTLTGTETITCKVRKPDDTENTINVANTSSSYVDVTFGLGDTDLSGYAMCELKIVKGTQTIGSRNFLLNIEADAFDGSKFEERSASGAIASFETNYIDNLNELIVNITATQAGSGTPSPSNPRAISGHSSCTITVEDDIDNPQEVNTVTISLGYTYYGGTLNVTTGVLTINTLYKSYDGSENWQVGIAQQGKYRIALNEVLENVLYPTSTSEDLDCICNMFVKSNGENTYSLINGISYQPNYGLRIYSSSYDTSDITPWKTLLSNTPLEVVYKLVTPTTVQLTPTEVRTLLGNNNIFADTGDIEVKYLIEVV